MNVFLGKFSDALAAMHETIGVDLAIAEDRPMAAEVRSYCADHGIPFTLLAPGDELAAALPPRVDLVVLASFVTRLQFPVIARCGLVLNFHGGIVECCRGRHPLPAAILAGHDEMGVTCHVIDDERMDAGPIVAQVRLPIDRDTSFAANDARLRRSMVTLVRLVLAEVRDNGRPSARRWTPAPGSYFKPVTAEDMERLTGVARLGDLHP